MKSCEKFLTAGIDELPKYFPIFFYHFKHDLPPSLVKHEKDYVEEAGFPLNGFGYRFCAEYR